TSRGLFVLRWRNKESPVRKAKRLITLNSSVRLRLRTRTAGTSFSVRARRMTDHHAGLVPAPRWRVFMPTANSTPAGFGVRKAFLAAFLEGQYGSATIM